MFSERFFHQLLFLVLISSPGSLFAGSVEDSTYSFEGRSHYFSISQRAQEEWGYAAGLLLTDVTIAGAAGPHLELGLRLQFLTNYGAATVYNFATTGNPNQFDSTNGINRPVIRARQLIYGNYYHGRWFIAEIGLPVFNVSGFTNEFYRYSSGRVALHEGLENPVADPYFELGATVRSLTQFKEPQNTGLIYPPTVDGMAGAQKKFGKTHLAFDFHFEQALNETTTAGSYDITKVPPYGASTRVWAGLETGYTFSSSAQFFLRVADRLFRWPDNDSSALWATFDEASLGTSIEVMWRGEFGGR